LLLFGRTALAQMDVPTRQAYVMALVDPDERTPAAAGTNTARYVARPAGPALAGVSQSLAVGPPSFLARALHSADGGVPCGGCPRAVALAEEPASSART